MLCSQILKLLGEAMVSHWDQPCGARRRNASLRDALVIIEGV